MTEQRTAEPGSKVALVTGASRGIGRAVALALAEDGYQLVLLARSERDLSAVLSEVQALAPATAARHTLHALDVSDFRQVEWVMAAMKERYGRIDVLVNNAGLYTPGTLEASMQAFERLLQVNLLAPFALMQGVIPMMKEQGTGHIINIASRSGKIGFAGDGIYGASKFGLVGLNESLYREVAAAGIRVTAICPSWTNTEMAQTAPLLASEMIQPADIVQTIRWLLNLSPAVCVREIVLECETQIH